MEKKSSENKTNKIFFIAVSISLIMILIACIVAYPQVIPEDQNQLAEVTEFTATEDTKDTSTEDYNQVDNLVTDIPKSTEPQIVITDTTTVTEIQTSTETEVQTSQDTSQNKTPTQNISIIMPIANGEVINEFSNGELIKSATSGIWQTHNGVDISAETNAPVQAIKDGTVTNIYEDALLGVCVTIDHTDFIANYCNLDKGVVVSEGDSVTIGTIIGTVGNTSTSESALENHLHLEILQNEKYINPMDLIQNTN